MMGATGRRMGRSEEGTSSQPDPLLHNPLSHPSPLLRSVAYGSRPSHAPHSHSFAPFAPFTPNAHGSHTHTHTHTHTHRCSILYTMYMFSNLPLPPHPHTLHTSRQVITFKQMFLMHPMHKDEVVTLVMGEEEAAKYLDSQ